MDGEQVTTSVFPGVPRAGPSERRTRRHQSMSPNIPFRAGAAQVLAACARACAWTGRGAIECEVRDVNTVNRLCDAACRVYLSAAMLPMEVLRWFLRILQVMLAAAAQERG